MTDEKPAPSRRPKSEKRQRTKLTAHRWFEDEFNKAAARATAAGLSFGAYIRFLATGEAGDRAQRRLPVDAEKLRRAEVLLSKGGTNLNQIAKNGNSGFPVELPELRLALKQWAEARDLLMEAMGKIPPSASAPQDA